VSDSPRVSEQIDLFKKGPSKAIPRLEWSTWITRAIGKKLADGYEYESEPPPRPPSKPSKPSANKPARPAWASKLTKELAAIRKLIKAANLEHRSADIEALARPAIRLKPKAVKSVTGIVTRFGGDPDVPASFRWPKGLSFVAQYRLDELARFDLEGKLPKRGLLSLFANLVPEDGYGERAKAFYYADIEQLAPLASPPDDWRATKIAIVTPSIALTLPPPDSSAAGALRLGDDERSRYHDEVWLASLGRDNARIQLLGWPDQMNQHAYTKGWTLLAQVISDDARLGLSFGDNETLRFHITDAKRKAANFGDVRSAIGGE
jgi:hypothetical protein